MTAEWEDDWFGFRRVKPGPVFHGFKGKTRPTRYDLPQAGEPSLCGRAKFGPQRVYKGPDARCCKTCATIWAARYPKQPK